MSTLIIYSHRNSDYTLDILSADVWVASAKNFRDADIVAQMLDGDDEPVPDTNPDVGSGPGTIGPSPLRHPVVA